MKFFITIFFFDGLSEKINYANYSKLKEQLSVSFISTDNCPNG